MALHNVILLTQSRKHYSLGEYIQIQKAKFKLRNNNELFKDK